MQKVEILQGTHARDPFRIVKVPDVLEAFTFSNATHTRQRIRVKHPNICY